MPPTPLSVRDKNIISWLEVQYHKTSSFPTLITIQSEWPKTFPTHTDLEMWLASPTIKQALKNRGIFPEVRPSATSDLSPQQAAAILTIANLSDRRSLPSKLKSLGITIAQWNAWKKKASFRDFLYQQLNTDFDSSLDRALSGLLKSVDSGNPRAIELYLEMTGRQPTENERNYRLAISRLVETITRHVKDPQVLRAISEDFKKIESGIDPATQINETQWLESPTTEPPHPVVITSSPHSIESSI